MRNRLYLVFFLTLLLLPLFFIGVNAACRITGYTMNSSGDVVVSSDYWAYCQNAVSNQHIYNSTGGLFSWGGPADTCNSYCGQVYVNATNVSDGIDGRCDQGYPLNAGNVPGWSNTTTKAVGNVTMYAPAAAGCVGATYTFGCGDLINESCTFNSNLDCTVGGGMGVASVSPITIECLNYVLSGSGVETMFTVLTDNVTIQNCNINTVNMGVASTADYTHTILNNIRGVYTYGLYATGADYFYSDGDEINCLDTVSAIGIESDPGMTTNDGVRVIGDTIDDCYLGLGHIAGNDLYVYQNTFGDNISGNAIDLLSASNYNITANIFDLVYEGAYGSRCSGIFQRNVFTSDNAMGGYGITLEEGSDNVIWNNSFYGFFDGVVADTETSLQVSKNYFNHNGATVPYAITIDASTASVVNNIVTSSSLIAFSRAFDCGVASIITYSGNNATYIDGGIYADMCLIVGINNELSNTDQFILSLNTGSTLALDDLTTDDSEIDLTATDIDLKESSLGGVTLPTNHSAIGIFYNMTDNGGGTVNINITYGSIGLVREDSLSLWKYNGTWTNISTSGVDVINNIVYSGDVSSFSLFAPLGETIAGGNVDETSCVLLRLVLILMAIAVMALSLWFAWSSWQKYETGSIDMQRMLGNFLVAMIGILIGIALLTATADLIAGICPV